MFEYVCLCVCARVRDCVCDIVRVRAWLRAWDGACAEVCVCMSHVRTLLGYSGFACVNVRAWEHVYVHVHASLHDNSW